MHSASASSLEFHPRDERRGGRVVERGSQDAGDLEAAFRLVEDGIRAQATRRRRRLLAAATLAPLAMLLAWLGVGGVSSLDATRSPALPPQPPCAAGYHADPAVDASLGAAGARNALRCYGDAHATASRAVRAGRS